MIDPDIFREELGQDAVFRVEQLGTTDAVIEAGTVANERGEPFDAIVGDVATPIPREAVETIEPSVIVRASVGVGTVDVAAAAEYGIPVIRVPEYCTEEVAVHTVALLLSCLRSIGTYDRSVGAGRWDWRDGRPIHRLSASAVGLVSLGPIARAVATLLEPYGCETLAYDPYVDGEEMADLGVEKTGFEELFDRADHVVVLAPLTADTRGMVDADVLSRLGPGSVLANTGRGEVIDEEDLVAALEADDLKMAGLDVLAEEPPGENHPLVGRDDVIVNPHAAWYSEESRTELNRRAARDLRRALSGEEPEGLVDPEAPWAT
ncbi:D-3-phosphoglycerate dehydrogenase/2-oxoglutarate reductase [Halalkaliarchaeum desulfuricum]|uniref:D-3-phosphoglycerate dehydrogenase/2-oxoglutarate reductase n=2 Tax=Halalkaliarchaeum desulfuricum TaxID=2055893 RepID=A0A343TJX5_9EURY|nr:D-3-phosphoglycerate dehydrogenase/2-oxoglutarate reductase [Halalkaliarchaeum desulfuricum]